MLLTHDYLENGIKTNTYQFCDNWQNKRTRGSVCHHFSNKGN